MKHATNARHTATVVVGWPKSFSGHSGGGGLHAAPGIAIACFMCVCLYSKKVWLLVINVINQTLQIMALLIGALSGWPVIAVRGANF